MAGEGKMGNGAPVCKWWQHTMACECVRSRLFIDGKETPFFIDKSCGPGHRHYGKKYGLMGAGMGDLIWQADPPYRIAARLASARTVAGLRHRAEQMAMGSRP